MAKRFKESPFHLTNWDDIGLISKAVVKVLNHAQSNDADIAIATVVVQRIVGERKDLFKKQYDKFDEIHLRLTGRKVPQSKKANYEKWNVSDKGVIMQNVLRQLGCGEVLVGLDSDFKRTEPIHKTPTDQPSAPRGRNTDSLDEVIEGVHAIITEVSNLIDRVNEREAEYNSLRNFVDSINQSLKNLEDQVEGRAGRQRATVETSSDTMAPMGLKVPNPSPRLEELRRRIGETQQARASEHLLH